jgi:hypothetical protein
MVSIVANIGLRQISSNWVHGLKLDWADEATIDSKSKMLQHKHLIKVIKIVRGMEILEQLLSEPSPSGDVLPFVT